MEFSAREGMEPPTPGRGNHKSLDMALGEHHGGVEADDGEEPRDVQDGLDDVLADECLRVVELRGIVPRERSAIVAVIDVSRVAIGVAAQTEGDGGVGLVVVVVVDLDLDARVGRKVRPVEAVSGERDSPSDGRTSQDVR